MKNQSQKPLDLFSKNCIVCFGDSITHGGYYGAFLQEFLAETDPAHLRKVINCGISGNQVTDLLKRVDVMLREEKPDLVFLMVGTNDLLFNVDFQEANLSCEEAAKKYPVFKSYEAGLEQLIDQIQAAGADVVILTTPPYNESSQPEITQAVKAHMDSSGMKNLFVIQCLVAAKKGIRLIDVATPLRENLIRNAKSFPRGKNDRIHPSKEEHRIITDTILGRHWVPGEKAEIVERYRTAQAKLQDIRWLLSLIPEDCVTRESKIRWHKNWVASLGPKDREYHEKLIPVMAEFEKNMENLMNERDQALMEMYQKPINLKG